jgi:hypothetical protein
MQRVVLPDPALPILGGKTWSEWRTLLDKDYGLNLYYYRNPGDWYDIKSNSDYNFDTATYTFYNLLPRQPYTFYLHSAFSDFGLTSSCPLDSVTYTLPDYTLPELHTNLSLICDQNNLGLLQLRIVGGTKPYTIQQTDSSFNTRVGNPINTRDSLINFSLSRGTYYFKMTDGCGTTAMVRSILSNQDSIKAVKDCDGSITLSYYSIPGARFEWKNGNTIVGDSSILRIPNPVNGTSYQLNIIMSVCQLQRTYIVNSINLNGFTAAITSSKASNTLCDGDTLTLTAEFKGNAPTVQFIMETRELHPLYQG